MKREDLRKNAESRLEGDYPVIEEKKPEEIAALVHDLKVHQIELEIQNEELRNTQAVLEKTKEEYVELYNNAPVGYLTLDRSGAIVKCNLTFLRMISREEATGRVLTDFIHEEDRSVFLGRFKAFFREPSGKSIEVRLGEKEKSRYVRLTGNVKDSNRESDRGAGGGFGHRIGRGSNREASLEGEQILIVLSDIHEQKLAEQQNRALLEEKELLLKEVHHRIKNNMNTIIGLLSLHSIKMEGTVAGDALEDALHRVETMLLVYEILYHSGSYRRIDLQDYFADLLSQLESSYAGRGEVSIIRELSSVEVEADTAFHVGIICNELVTNAFKYAFNGRDKGLITVFVSPGDGRSIHLSISDDGVGVPETFDPATSDGFGLFLIRGMLEQLGGSMEINRLDPGTQFRITFPIRKKG